MIRRRRFLSASLMAALFFLPSSGPFAGAGNVCAACPLLFRSPRSFNTEKEPTDLLFADLNEDGLADLVASNHGNRWVSVLLADGADPGRFLSTPYRVWGGPLGMIASDFNHDTVFDIAVACESTGTVSVLIGNGSGGVGDGTYPPRSDYTAGAGASSVADGDFDGDGNVDLVVACASIDSVAFLKGNGDGTFQGPIRYKAGVSGAAPKDLVAFQANGDTLLDLALPLSGVDSIAFLAGLGGGAFALPVNYATGGEPWSIVTGDFDGDGVADLATANRFGDNVSLFAGNGTGGIGDGTFQPAVNTTVGNGAWQLDAADLGGDGATDLVVSMAYTDLVVLLTGNGDGTFAPAESLDAGDLPAGVAVGDGNGDPYADIAVASRYSNDVSLLAADPTGDGTLIVKHDFDVGPGPQALAARDFNEDGILDLVSGDTQQDRITVLIGDGAAGVWNGGFLPGVVYAAGNYPTSIAVEDFNEDGILDLAMSNRFSDDMTIMLGNGAAGVGDGTFQPPVSYAGGWQNRHVAPADFNGDGILDIFNAGFISNSVTMWMGNGAAGVGDGTFTMLGTLSPGSGPQYIAVADYNGDAILDLAVVLANDNTVAVMIGGGASTVWDSTFSLPVTYAIGTFPTCVKTLDLNGDGILDLITADQLSDQVSVLLGNGTGGVGDGTFAAAVPYTTGTGPRRLALADYNGDGFTDVATGNRYSDDFSVLAGVGDGTFAAEERFDAGNQPWPIITADLDGDGASDVVVGNWDGHDVSVILNTSCVYVGIDAAEGGALPVGGRHLFNRPNPFNPVTEIRFTLDRPGATEVDIYDVRGRLVRKLFRGNLPAGIHGVSWDGTDGGGRSSVSGVYFYALRAAGATTSGKMILAR